MYARLSFATAILGQPDILIVDEILSVGDFAFRQKCLDRMNKLKARSAILFVSHSFGTVRMFCDRGIALDHGEKIFEGDIGDAVDTMVRQQERSVAAQKGAGQVAPDEAGAYGPIFQNADKITDVRHVWVDENGNEVGEFFRTDDIRLQYSFHLGYKPGNLLIGIPVFNSAQQLVTSFGSELQGHTFDIDADGWVRGELEIKAGFNSDRYQAVMAIHDGPEFIYRNLLPPLVIAGEHPRLFGSIRLPHTWK
jgi:ABC-type molybdate transport system ATPase subunit